MRKLDFYFDPISPYVYLACTQLPAFIKKHSLHIHCVPVLFAGLLNAHGQKGPAEIPAKRRYTFLDCMRLGQSLGVPFEMPPAHPFNPLLPLRMATAIAEDDKRFHFTLKLATACWGSGQDLTNPAVLNNLADDCGLDGENLLKTAVTDPIKKQLKDATDSAISRGVFGVPTFGIDGELFWGHDRMDLMGTFLEGKIRIDPAKFENALNRPRGADRKTHEIALA